MDEEGRKAEELKFEESLAPVPDQKTLVLVNTFIIQTAGLLNRFSALCERKLEAVNRNIQRVDVQLSLLEAKLNSVDGLAQVRATASSGAAPDASTPSSTNGPAPASPAAAAPPPPPPPPPGVATAVPGGEAPAPATPTPPPAAEPQPVQEAYLKVKDHSEYAKFFRMERMGVPAQAVKNKMALEGLDADMLDNPDAPAPED
ncbi:hypothetical protein CYMTET_48352 [Cymbomonas tetramitiformis]|uniref:WASH complex subunit CCDC53 n=1 Tax=Cymbomonas tetramitiformis TaxID=36881 RepID=A0AAE0BTP6_9CHLO|nr:hypothetical protein CYMTET_48352 [Cymbomonas tetramitiformis]